MKLLAPSALGVILFLPSYNSGGRAVGKSQGHIKSRYVCYSYTATHCYFRFKSGASSPSESVQKKASHTQRDWVFFFLLFSCNCNWLIVRVLSSKNTLLLLFLLFLFLLHLFPVFIEYCKTFCPSSVVVHSYLSGIYHSIYLAGWLPLLLCIVRVR